MAKKISSAGIAQVDPTRFSLTEISKVVNKNENTVRSHFSSFSDVFTADDDIGPRGKRAFCKRTLGLYQMFLLLKGPSVRLKGSQAIKLLRDGHYDTLQEANNRNIETLILTVGRITNGTN